MSVNLVRTTRGWYVLHGGEAFAVNGDFPSTATLLTVGDLHADIANRRVTRAGAVSRRVWAAAGREAASTSVIAGFLA